MSAPVRVVERRVLAQAPEDLRHVARAEDLLAELAVLPGQLLDLLEADLVDLLGRSLEGRVVADHPVVGVIAVGEPGQPDVLVVAGVRPDPVAERVAVARPSPAGRRSRRRRAGAPARRRHRRRRSARPCGGADRRRSASASQRSIWATVSSTANAAGRPVAGHALEHAGRSCPGSSSRSPRVLAIIASATSAFGIGSFGHVDREARDGPEDRVDAELREAGVEDLGVAAAVERRSSRG